MARILLDDPAHAGGSDQILVGTVANDGTGDNARIAFQKVKQNLADLNSMTTELYGANIPVIQTYASLVASYPAASFQAYEAVTSDLGPCYSDGNSWIPVGSAWRYPGLGPNFTNAIAGLKLVDDQTFGSSAVASGAPGSIAINNTTQLATYYNSIPGTLQGGIGASGGEAARPAVDFTTAAHSFSTDHLNLNTILLSAVDWGTPIYGNTSASGITINALGGTTATAISALNLANTTGITVGQVVGIVNWGTYFVSAVVTNTSVTLVQLRAATTAPTAGNMVVFVNAYVAFVNQTITNGSTGAGSTPVNFVSVPAGVVAGMFAEGVQSVGAGISMTSSDRALVTATTSTTVTFSGAIFPGQTLNVANNSLLIFYPGALSGNLYSKKLYSPIASGVQVIAFEAVISYPDMGASVSAGTMNVSSQTAFASLFSTYPNLVWGFWPAVWTLSQWDGTTTSRNPHSEIDILEMQIAKNMGTSTWSGNNWDQQFTSNLSTRNGSWNNSTAPTSFGQLTANAADFEVAATNPNGSTNTAGGLILPHGFFDGAQHKVQLLWTKDRLIRYIDGFPIREDFWSIDSDFLHQFIISYAVRGVPGLGGGSGPLSGRSITNAGVKVYRFRSWAIF